MRTRQRHHSREITFDLSVKNSVQLSYGGTGNTAVLAGRQIQTAFQSLTSTYPIPARFLDLPSTGGG